MSDRVMGLVAVGLLWAAVTETGMCSEGTGPKREHFAFVSDVDYLDGPSLEALGSGKGCMPTTDSDGNLYLVCKYSTCRLRCARTDGRVETIVGDDRWPGNLKLSEGPASYLHNRCMTPVAGEYSKPGAIITVYGLPLKGEDHGRIYFFWPGDCPYRIFKNKDKGDRWWFKRVGAPDKPKPPATAGATVKMDECNLTDAIIGDRFVGWQGNVYNFDEAKGEMTCAFTLADYESKAKAFLNRTDKALGPPEHYARTEDGSIYMIYFWKTYPGGQIFRMSADRSKFEHIVSDNSQRLKGQGVGNRNGPGLGTSWHCGPATISASGDTLFLHAIDSVAVRRWMGGRVASLCYDGEWRELPTGGRSDRKAGVVHGKHHQPGQHGANYIYINYPGEENGGDNRVYRFGPADFARPTAGPLFQEGEQSEKRKEEGGQR